VCTTTWEVEGGVVHQYEGGYAAYVLARAERDRQASAREDRRQQLMRKELAWLRRGAAGADLEAEVPHRGGQRPDRRRARGPRPGRAAAASRTARLGGKVLEAEGVSVAFAGAGRSCAT
jgi:ATP-binding cassette subfamily F protein uup